MPTFYVLNDVGEAEPAADVIEWGRWFEGNHHTRMVAKTTVGEAEVSTVFLGLDHQLWSGPPLIFETMIFGGEWDEYQWRWSSRAQAVAGHDQVVAALREGKQPDPAVA